MRIAGIGTQRSGLYHVSGNAAEMDLNQLQGPSGSTSFVGMKFILQEMGISYLKTRESLAMRIVNVATGDFRNDFSNEVHSWSSLLMVILKDSTGRKPHVTRTVPCSVLQMNASWPDSVSDAGTILVKRASAAGAMQRRGPSHLGPYGRACTGCFKAKFKCVARSDGPGCQRCHRLSKLCQPSDSIRHRAIHRTQDSDARIAELERKLDGLIERLEPPNDQGSGTLREHQNGLHSKAPNLGNESPPLDAFAAEHTPRDSRDTQNYVEIDEDDDTRTNLRTPGADSTPRMALERRDSAADVETDETLLSRFRSPMLQHFPFLHLPSDLSARQLQRDRPFLWRAIVCVASRREKAALSSSLKRAMCEALLLEETDRMDLLLGLLTYFSWGWDHSKAASRLMMQAVSLAGEISNANPYDMDAPMRAFFMPGVDTDVSPPKGYFLEHQRAVLGCFVLSSAVSTYFDHVDALRWTAQMGEGLAALSASRMCPTDAALVAQVRLQLVSQKAVHIRQQQQTEQAYMQAPAGTTSMPALLSLMVLQGDLQGLQASMSVSELARHLVHVSATELVINETIHAVNTAIPFMISHFSAITAGSTVSNGLYQKGERSRCLWQCVNAIKASTDALLALPASDFVGISFVQWTQLARSILALNHLTTTIEDPSWDRAAVRAVIDMPVLLDRVIKKLELAAQIAGEYNHEGCFSELAFRMRQFCSDLRGSAARHRRASEDMNARSRVYGGAQAEGLENIT